MKELQEVEDVLEPLMRAYGTDDLAVLAQRLGRDVKTLRVWRHRGLVPLGVLVKASEDTGVPRQALVVDQPPQNLPIHHAVRERAPPVFFPETAKQVKRKQKANPPQDSASLGSDEFILVHGYDVRASAGNGSAVSSEQPIARFAFHRNWIARKGLRPSSLAIVTAKGDSMEPTVKDGDILLVDISTHAPAIDGMHLIERDGDLYCKRLQPLHKGGLRVVSDNDRYLPQELSASEAQGVRVVGRVIWVGGER